MDEVHSPLPPPESPVPSRQPPVPGLAKLLLIVAGMIFATALLTNEALAMMFGPASPGGCGGG